MATELAQLAGRLELDVLPDGRPANPVVVLPLDRWRDAPPALIDRAAGLVTVQGDATKSDVLRLAGAQHASSIIVATNRDDTAVLVTLTTAALALLKISVVLASSSVAKLR